MSCSHTDLLVHVLLQVPQHHVQVRGTANHRLINIASVHLEVVQGSHQMVQLCNYVISK